MQIACFLSRSTIYLSLALNSCAATPARAPAAAASGSLPRLVGSGDAITVATGTGTARISVDLQGVPTNPDGQQNIELVHRAPGYVIVVDTRASAPQPLSRCQAGQERFLRVLSLVHRRETFARLVDSCLRSVVPGDPVIEWAPGGGGFELIIVSGGRGGSFSVAPDGTVAAS